MCLLSMRAGSNNNANVNIWACNIQFALRKVVFYAKSDFLVSEESAYLLQAQIGINILCKEMVRALSISFVTLSTLK